MISLKITFHILTTPFDFTKICGRTTATNFCKIKNGQFLTHGKRTKKINQPPFYNLRVDIGEQSNVATQNLDIVLLLRYS